MTRTFDEVIGEFCKSLSPEIPLREIPTIEKWLEDPFYSGAFAWDLWDGVKQSVADIINGRQRRGDFNKAIVTGGIGTGKTSTLVPVFQYEIQRLLSYPSPPIILGLSANSTVIFAIFSTKLQKAYDAVFKKLYNNICVTEWFRERPHNDHVKRRLEWPNLVVMPFASNVQSAISEDVYWAILDECNFWTDAETDSIEEVSTSLERRMVSRFSDKYLMLYASSATTWDSFTEKNRQRVSYFIAQTPWGAKGIKFDKYFRVDIGDQSTPPRILGPDDKGRRVIRVPEQYKHLAEDDIYGFLRDTVGIGVTEELKLYHGSTFSRYDWEDNKNEEEYLIPPLPELVLLPSDEPRIIHVDLAAVHCWCGFACGYIEKAEWLASEDGVMELIPIIHYDFAIRIKSSSDDVELDFAKIRELIYWIGEQKPIALVTYDGWESRDSIQRLRDRGFNAQRISVDRTPEPHNFLKRLFLEHRIIMPYNAVLLEELKGLEKHPKTGKIDHPKRFVGGEPGSKDVADAAAGVAWSAHEFSTNIQTPSEEVPLECLIF